MNTSPVLTNLTPAVDWRDGSPLGNGTTGAMVYGRVSDERILLNHEELWYEGITPDLPDVAKHLPELRRLMDQGDYAQANAVYPDAIAAAGGLGATGKYHPAGDLRIMAASDTIFNAYRRHLNMETGQVCVSWRDGEVRQDRESFVSRTDDLFVMRLRTSAAQSMKSVFRLEPHDLRDAIDQNAHPYDVPIDFESRADKGLLFLTGTYRQANGKSVGLHAGFGIVARVIAQGGSTRVTDHGLEVCGAGEVLVLVRIFAGAKDVDAAGQRVAQELLALDHDYEALFDRHAAAHRALFNRTTVSLTGHPGDTATESLLLDAYEHGEASTELAEKMTSFGRYLLIASAGKTPSHLQGVWNGDYLPPWDCFYMANENLQMNYWQALPGALPELARGVFDFYLNLIEDFRANAKGLFGCRGVLIPAITTPFTGLATNPSPHIVYWVSGAGWLAQHFVDQWRFTGDDAFLRDALLPFLVEIADFYEDFLVADDNQGLHFCPSTSPENTPANFLDRPNGTNEAAIGGEVRLSTDATMDVAVAREVLGNLIELSAYAELHQDRVAGWRSMRDRLPGYQVNEHGAMREWLDPRFLDHDAHRHLSHLYPFFPGTEVTAENNPQLIAACRTAVKRRQVVGLSQQTGWSLAHMANIYARFGDGERSVHCLDMLSRTSLGNNLFTYHNDDRGMGVTLDLVWGRRPPFQIDANMGWTSAVYEMLLFSTATTLRLAPGLPRRWNAGRADGLQTRAQTTVSLAWDQSDGWLRTTLRSEREQTLDIVLPTETSRVSGCDVDVAASGNSAAQVRIVLPAGRDIELMVDWVPEPASTPPSPARVD